MPQLDLAEGVNLDGLPEWAQNGLTVKNLTSVGLVPAGANTAADLTFWKSMEGNQDTAKALIRLKLSEMLERVTKQEAVSFAEVLSGESMEDVLDEVWQVVNALRVSIVETLQDEDADRDSIIRGSIGQFSATVEGALEAWLDGRSLDLAKSAGNTSASKTADGSTVGRGSKSDDGGKMPKGDTPTLADDVRKELDESVVAYLDHLEKAVAEVPSDEDIEKRIAGAVEEAVAKATADPSGEGSEGDPVDLSKLDPTVRGLIEKAQADAQAATKAAEDTKEALDAEVEKRRNAEFAKTAEGYKHLGETGDVLSIVKAVDGLDEPVQALLKGVFDRYAALAATSEVMKRAGASLDGPDPEAGAKFLKTAEDMVAKSVGGDSPLTIEQAVDKLADSDPQGFEAWTVEDRETRQEA